MRSQRGSGKAMPSYRKHRSSGQAVVTILGRDHYMGPFGTKASKLEYDRLIAEWLANGRQPTIQPDAITVVEVIAAYVEFSKKHHQKNGKPTSSFKGLKSALRLLKVMYGRTLAAEFGPRRLKALRPKLEEHQESEAAKVKRLSRGTINAYVATIRRLFRWAASEEMIPASVAHALDLVLGLERGKCSSPETAPVRPVDDTIVDLTLDHLPEVVADMVRLQRLAGMRPAEVCIVRPVDVEMSGDVWLFRPESHKTEHHGLNRIIAIGPQAQDVLRK